MDNVELDKMFIEAFRERGECISSFALIEWGMSDFIAYHYFKESPTERDKFKSEVLDDPWLNFSLRKRIFRKLLEKYYPDVDKHIPRGLGKLKEMRDKIAHAKLAADWILNEEGEIVKIIKMYYLIEGEKYESKQMYTEFSRLATLFEGSLINLPGFTGKLTKLYDPKDK